MYFLAQFRADSQGQCECVCVCVFGAKNQNISENFGQLMASLNFHLTFSAAKLADDWPKGVQFYIHARRKPIPTDPTSCPLCRRVCVYVCVWQKFASEKWLCLSSRKRAVSWLLATLLSCSLSLSWDKSDK